MRSAWLDGEIVVLDADGTPNFNALQNAFDSARTESIVYFLFDLPYFDGYDLRRVPLSIARARCCGSSSKRTAAAQLRFSADFDADAGSLLESACGAEARRHHRQAHRRAVRVATAPTTLAQAEGARSARSS